MKMYTVDYPETRGEEAARNYGPFNMLSTAREAAALAVWAAEDEVRWSNSALGARSYDLAIEARNATATGAAPWPHPQTLRHLLMDDHLYDFCGWRLITAHDEFDGVPVYVPERM